MKIIAIIWLILILLDKVLTPFLFGRERTPYNALSWAIGLVLSAPLVYLLWVVATTH